jgi:Ca2+-binding RTX toxin-like protein
MNAIKNEACVRTIFMSGALLAALGACNDVTRDTGQVMACYGFVNMTIPGDDVPSSDVASNVYYGGCDPSDPGMQIVQVARPTATSDELVAACDASCNARLALYAAIHPETKLPLSCSTFFALPCPLNGSLANVPATANVGFWSGGPADTRYAVSGHVILDIDGVHAEVPASGIIDHSLGPCEGAGQTCDINLSRIDVKADGPFMFGPLAIDAAQLQSAGPAKGRQSGPEFLIPERAINAEVTFTTGGQPQSLLVQNTKGFLKSIGPTNGALGDFDVTFGEPPRTARVVMTATPAGHRPTAAMSPAGGTFECACKECTNVRLASAAADVDNDLQSLAWLVDGKLLPESSGVLERALPLGPHTVALVATDTRGAAAAANASVKVVDTTPPVITAPANVTLRSCDFASIGQATATDACSAALVTTNDPGDYRVGITTVTWTAEDSSLNVSRANQTVQVVAAKDDACCPAGSNVIRGTNGSDRLVGTPGPDCIIGYDGDDVIDGLGGDDTIVAGQGQDRITAGDGNDVVLAGDGDDVIDGGSGNDRINGGSGQDKITGGDGDDELRGGDGDDVIHAGPGNDVVSGGQGQDQLYGEDGDDLIAGNVGDDKLFGGPGNDRLAGGVTQDFLVGEAGNDVLIGIDGDDTLDGGPGDDLLAGGSGHNRCIGGGGSDTFQWCEFRQ